MVNNQGFIIPKLRYRKGRGHDYIFAYKKSRPIMPKDVLNVFDLGYLPWRRKGFSCGTATSTPTRKQINFELSAREKEYNKNHYRKRILIEHTIFVNRKNMTLADVFRNKLRKYNRMSDIVIGLINYRIE